MYNADMKAPNGLGVGPLFIRDTQGAAVLLALKLGFRVFRKPSLGRRWEAKSE